MRKIAKIDVLFIAANLSLFIVLPVSDFFGVGLAGIYISTGIYCFLISGFFHFMSEILVKDLRDACDVDTIVKQAMFDMRGGFSEMSMKYLGRKRTAIYRCVFHLVGFIPMILSFAIGIVILGIKEHMLLFFGVLASVVAFYVVFGYYVVQKAITVLFITMMNKKIDEVP
jgi:hypothetical protein